MEVGAKDLQCMLVKRDFVVLYKQTIFPGTSSFEPVLLTWSCLITIVIFLIGLSVFNYTEKDFMDTV